MTKRTIALVIFCLTTAAIVAAQGHPVMNGPIRSEDTSPFDVEMIRTFIALGPAAGSSSGVSFVYLSSDTPEGGALSLRAEGFLVSRVFVNGAEPDWHQDGQLLSIELPSLERSSTGTPEWHTRIEYLIGEVFSVRKVSDRKIAIWDGSEPGSDVWYPTPVDQMDSYFTQLRVSVPKFWDVWIGGGEGLSHPERIVEGFSQRPVFSGAASFLAFDTRSVFPESSTVPILAGHTKGIDSFIDSFNADRAAVKMFLESTGWQNPDSVFDFALADGLEGSQTIGLRMVTTAEYAVTSNPWEDRFRTLKSVVSGVTGSTFESIPPTDSWLSFAIPSWIALEIMEQQEGEGAAGLIYETLRDTYLEEAEVYRRPLVWDRWENVADIFDQHAEGKGVWVMRMLSERVGPDKMRESVSLFLDSAKREVVDTESFRDILELVSGESLSAFFDTWVYSAGHPELVLTYLFNAGSETTEVTVEQRQSGFLVPDAFEFDMAIQYSSLAATNTSMVRIEKRNQTSNVTTSLIPKYVFPDAFATVLLDYATPLNQNDVVAQLRDAIGSVPRVRSLRHLRKYRPDPAVLLGLRIFLREETDPAILATACDMLGEMAPSSSALSQLLEFSSHQDERVRQAAIRALSRFPDAEEAFNAALNAANTGTEARVLSESVSTLVRIRPSLSWGLIQSSLVTPSDGDLVVRTALNLVESGITEDRNLFGAIRPLISEENPISVRIAAYEAFARIDAGGQTVERTTEEWLESDEFRLRKVALETLILYPEIEYSKKSVQDLLDTDPSVRLHRLAFQVLN